MHALSRHIRATLLLSLLAAAALPGLAGCGGDDEGARDALIKSFDQPIGSANVTLDVEARVKGVQQLAEPVRAKLTGPYQSNGKTKIPSFDWDLSLSGGGQSVSAGLVSTGDNAFVNFQGAAYEIGEETVARNNQQLGQQGGQGDRSLKDFGIDPARWIKDTKDEGDEEVAGVDTQHVSAGVDVARLLEDLNRLVSRAGNLAQQQGQAPPAELTPEQRDQISDAVDEAKLNVWIGKDDDKIRRLSVELGVDVPDEARAGVGGAEGGQISFSLEFANVGGRQTIVPPRDARPIKELSDQLGGLGGLGGGAGGGGAGGAGGGAGGSGGSGGGSNATPSPEAFRRYSRCVDAADPGDLDAIQRCSELLR